MVKRDRMRLAFCKGDAVVIFFVILLAIFIGVLFMTKMGTDRGTTVCVYQDGIKIQELPLGEDTEILIQNSYTNKLSVKDEKAAIVESDCPGMDCVHSGWIGGKGRSLVCLPNRVEIRIEGESDSEVDFIVR
mgnify:FL=1